MLDTAEVYILKLIDIKSGCQYKIQYKIQYKVSYRVSFTVSSETQSFSLLYT